MIENKNNNANGEQLILFSNNGSETLYLTENDKPFPPEDYKGEGDSRYEYRNDVLIYDNCKGRYYPFRLFLNGIKVTEGKITFFVEDDEEITIEDMKLLHDICADDENPSPNKYESFWGKESILKHHATSVCWFKSNNHRWFNNPDIYGLNLISECIHDGVTSFIIHNYGEFEDDFEVCTHF